MSVRLRALVGFTVALCIALSGLSWSAHLDMPAIGDDAATHAHVDGGDTVSDCDHCCHASAHLIALAPTSGAHESLAAGRHRPQPVASVPQAVPEPPFTPPIV